jgi:adenylosuccinate synthase
MPVTAIVGAQWGDEGKGKITDLLSQDADLVIRFGGGSNAGHTVINHFGEFKLHLIPSGIFNANALALIGSGTVVDLDYLETEFQQLDAAHVPYSGLRISSRAHLTMPYHVALDGAEDTAREDFVIGTTRRGVGPTYVDKAGRVGIQAGDLMHPDVLASKIRHALRTHRGRLDAIAGYQVPTADELLARAEHWRTRFGEFIVDQIDLLEQALDQDWHIVLEGQLGALRDLDWGTYPYVTSSTTIAGGGAVGGGVPPRYITNVIGVVKAYTSAVGEGPVPTELTGDASERLRERGQEFGATTGRPRRVGWFDAVATRYAHRLNRFTGIAVTKLDILDGESEIKLCTGYELHGRRLNTVPITPDYEAVTPVYETMPGWQGRCADARTWSELPDGARAYLQRIEETVGARVRYVSVGPERDQTIEVCDEA